jgi:hypothetical protein
MIPSNSFAILFLVGGITSIVAANFAMYAMVGQVNARLPEEQRFSFFGFYLAKNHRIIQTYKELYPGGRLLWWYRGCITLTILFLAMAAYNDK